MNNKSLLESFQDKCPWPVKIFIYFFFMFLTVKVVAASGAVLTCLCLIVICPAVLYVLGSHPSLRRRR
jgi:hypothetical protein